MIHWAAQPKRLESNVQAVMGLYFNDYWAAQLKLFCLYKLTLHRFTQLRSFENNVHVFVGLYVNVLLSCAAQAVVSL